MPKSEVLIYQTINGRAPLMSWLNRQNQRVQDKATELIALLEERGHTLGMPHTKVLRDGIWELRVIVQRVQHRILYAFVGKNVVLLTNGLTKTSKVPAKEIDKAVRYKNDYKQNPNQHTYRK